MEPVIRVKSEQERVALAQALARHRLERMAALSGGASQDTPLEQEVSSIAQWICVESPTPETHVGAWAANDDRG
jgi:hypothetical protein